MSRPAAPAPTSDARARARRSRLVWSAGALPVIVALLLLAVPMASADLVVRATVRQAADGKPGYRSLDLLAGHDLVEQWRADYDRGTARLLAGQGWTAVGPLRKALDGVPQAHRCMVQDNLLLADQALIARTKDPDEADSATREVERLRADPVCGDPKNDQPNPSPSGKPQPSPSGTGSGDDQAEQERQRELDERQQGADSDAERHRQSGDLDFGDGFEGPGQGDDNGTHTPSW